MDIANTNNVETFGYNAESLAQWKVERGRDEADNAFGFPLALLFFPGFWFLLPIVLPFSLYHYVKGNKLRKEGETEGGVGRGYRCRGSEAIAPNQWELEVGPHVRRVKAPITPPAHLVETERPKHLYETL